MTRKHAAHYRRYLPSGQLAIDQGEEGHWLLSYNPDDDRFYVVNRDDDSVVTTFKADYRGWSNAIYYARTH